MAPWAGHCPAKQRVASLIPRQGTLLGCGFGPGLGCVQEATDLFLSHIDSSLPLSLPPYPLSLSKKEEKIAQWLRALAPDMRFAVSSITDHPCDPGRAVPDIPLHLIELPVLDGRKGP